MSTPHSFYNPDDPRYGEQNVLAAGEMGWMTPEQQHNHLGEIHLRQRMMDEQQLARYRNGDFPVTPRPVDDRLQNWLESEDGRRAERHRLAAERARQRHAAESQRKEQEAQSWWEGLSSTDQYNWRCSARSAASVSELRNEALVRKLQLPAESLVWYVWDWYGPRADENCEHTERGDLGSGFITAALWLVAIVVIVAVIRAAA
ncbi:hypothetical protein [Streptomyces sp. NPDC006997]|uniref:hypothetical protein n=1 Tax=Streptomyces sp. NPDC006997 TaxID=3155356 RepID=UPI0033CED352